jgi:hypothetical protein
VDTSLSTAEAAIIQSLKRIFKRNIIDARVLKQQYSANFPVEDYMCTHQLKENAGYLMAMFDGHGGPELVFD